MLQASGLAFSPRDARRSTPVPRLGAATRSRHRCCRALRHTPPLVLTASAEAVEYSTAHAVVDLISRVLSSATWKASASAFRRRRRGRGVRPGRAAGSGLLPLRLAPPRLRTDEDMSAGESRHGPRQNRTRTPPHVPELPTRGARFRNATGRDPRRPVPNVLPGARSWRAAQRRARSTR